jgi:hypothetical protein
MTTPILCAAVGLGLFLGGWLLMRQRNYAFDSGDLPAFMVGAGILITISIPTISLWIAAL